MNSVNPSQSAIADFLKAADNGFEGAKRRYHYLDETMTVHLSQTEQLVAREHLGLGIHKNKLVLQGYA